MTPVPLSAFASLTRPHCPECPRPLLEDMLRLSAVEWCEVTRAWRHITTTTVGAQGEAIVAPAYAAIFEIEKAEYDGAQLYPVQFSTTTRRELDAENIGAPRYITQVSPGTVSLIPFASGGTLEMSVFLKPKSGVRPDYGGTVGDSLAHADNFLPDYLFTQDAEAIVCGALYRIFSIPNMEWRDPNLAAQHRAAFDAAAARKQTGSIEGQQNAPIRTRAYFF